MPIESASSWEGIEYYTQLTWHLTVVITILVLLLCCLYLAMRRAIEREHSSLTFSNLAIEGMETERRRISRELHDNVLPQVRDQGVADQIRMICNDLMPPDFSRLSLKDSLAAACDKFSKRSGIKCGCFIQEELDLGANFLQRSLSHRFSLAESLRLFIT